MMQDKLWNGQLTVGSLRKVLEKLSDPLEVSYEEPARAMLWRVLLGVLPLPASLTATTCLDENYSVSQNWAATMDTMTRDYYNLKVNTMPSKERFTRIHWLALWVVHLPAGAMTKTTNGQLMRRHKS